MTAKKNSLHNKRVAGERNRGLRLDIIAKLYKHGYSYREIREEVMQRLDLDAYSLQTVKKDIDVLLEQWRTERSIDIEANIGAELARIDEIIREAWEAWEKSKEDGEITRNKQKGVPNAETGEITTAYIEKVVNEQRNCGDPRYLDIIDKQLKERRKLLGLYAAEKKEVTGVMTFADALMRTGIDEDEE